MSRVTHGPRSRCSVLALSLVAVLAASPALAADEQSIDAFSAWDGRGVIYETGPGSATFLGAIVGALFIETGKGPVGAGEILCPAMLEIDLETAKQSGAGKCTITAADGAKVFADWSCQGVHLVGCDGEITLTGGSGRMAGVTGAGKVSVRSTDRMIAAEVSDEAAGESSPAGPVMELGSGILLLREVTYVLPAQ